MGGLFSRRRLINTTIFFDIAVQGSLVGRVEITLREDLLPKTCNRIKTHCMKRAMDHSNSNALSKECLPPAYEGSVIHRIEPGIGMQGGRINDIGDYEEEEGMAKVQDFTETYYDDENFSLAHSHAGIVTLANSGPNSSSSSEFYICMQPSPWLDGKHTAFGEVSNGMDVLERIEKLACNVDGKMRFRVVIVKAGIVQNIIPTRRGKTGRKPRSPKKKTKT
eukprot:g2234.t1